MILPSWAKKPRHKKEVVATQKGWVVKETGEVLVSHKNLEEKIDALMKEMKGFVSDMQSEPEPEEPEPVEEKKEEEEEEKPKPTRRKYTKRKTTQAKKQETQSTDDQ